jgi:hypothetical protein
MRKNLVCCWVFQNMASGKFYVYVMSTATLWITQKAVEINGDRIIYWLVAT